MTSQLKIENAYKNGIENTCQRWYNESGKHKIQVSQY